MPSVSSSPTSQLKCVLTLPLSEQHRPSYWHLYLYHMSLLALLAQLHTASESIQYRNHAIA
jgi:hypothetical protein